MITELKKESYAKLLEIANELSKIGWEIKNINFDKCLILVSKFFALITIYADTYERKISLSDENNKSCYRYCELSRNDDMVNCIIKLINEFRHENYKLSFINRYGQTNGHDRIEEYYFPNESSLLRTLVGEPVEDENIYSLEEREHQYPNPAIKLVIKRIKDDRDFKNKYWQFKDSLLFELHQITYATKEDGYNKKVLDEIKEDQVFYACVTIKE